MANRYLYMGVKAGFTRNVGTVADQTATTAAYNSTYVDGSVLVNNNTAAFFTDFTTGDGANDFATTGETVWSRFDLYYSGGSYNVNAAIWVNESDQHLFRFRIVSNNVGAIYYNSGTLATPVWTQLGTNVTINSATRVKIDLKLVIDAAGTAHVYELYANNSLLLSGTFSMALLTQIDAIRFSDTSSTSTHISQVLVTVGISTINSFVPSIKASGAGSNSDMSGAFTDVNETVLNDATVVSSTTAAQRTTFAMGDLPALPTGAVIGAEVRHVFRANNDGGASPQNIKPVIRQSGADTVGTAVSGLGLGFGPFMTAYSLTHAQINTAGFELGWESSA